MIGRRIVRRRMVARAAAVGGTAYIAGKHVANKETEQQEQAAPPVAAPAQPDTVDQLRRLAELRDQGVLTEEEFTAEKRKILGM
jgi:Short C-terminal domain